MQPLGRRAPPSQSEASRCIIPARAHHRGQHPRPTPAPLPHRGHRRRLLHEHGQRRNALAEVGAGGRAGLDRRRGGHPDQLQPLPSRGPTAGAERRARLSFRRRSMKFVAVNPLPIFTTHWPSSTMTQSAPPLFRLQYGRTRHSFLLSRVRRPVCEERPGDREVVSGERDLVVVEAFDGSDHLGEHAEVEARVAKSRTSAQPKRASSFRPASSRGASVGPRTVMVGRLWGGESNGESTRVSSPARVTTIRQNVGLSWIQVDAAVPFAKRLHEGVLGRRH